MPQSVNQNLPRVLFVDDDSIVTRFIENSFSNINSDFFPVVAKNGEEAIQILKSQRIQAVVTDLHMPKVDGTQLLEHIAAQYPGIPCGILTSNPLETNINKDFVKAYIKKPVKADAIYSAVVEMLRSHSQLSGRLSGISLPNLLQLIESDRKTGTIEIKTPHGQSGYLFVKLGKLLDASFGDLTGREAALSLLSVQVEEMVISPLPKPEPGKVIQESVMALLMEVVHLVDENSRDSDSLDGGLDSDSIREALENYSGVCDAQVKLLLKPLLQFKSQPFFCAMIITDTFDNLWYWKSDVSFLNQNILKGFVNQLSLASNKISNFGVDGTSEIIWTTEKTILIYQPSPVLGNIQLNILFAIAPGPHQNMFRSKLKHTVKNGLRKITELQAYKDLEADPIFE